MGCRSLCSSTLPVPTAFDRSLVGDTYHLRSRNFCHCMGLGRSEDGHPLCTHTRIQLCQHTWQRVCSSVWCWPVMEVRYKTQTAQQRALPWQGALTRCSPRPWLLSKSNLLPAPFLKVTCGSCQAHPVLAWLLGAKSTSGKPRTLR